MKAYINLKTLFFHFLSGGLIFLFGCNGSISNESDYLKWLSNPSNGLVKTRHIQGFDIRIKFLPPEYLLHRDISRSGVDYSPARKDSLMNTYKNSLTFMMTIGPDKEDSNNSSIMYYGVKTYKDYVQRDLMMNFDFKQYMSLEANGKKYLPVLSAMENSYELGLSRNFIFVFVPIDKADNNLFSADELDFSYDDELFDLGLNHFIFRQKDLKNTPDFPGLAIK